MNTKAAFDFVVADELSGQAEDGLGEILDWIRSVSGKIAAKSRNKRMAIRELNKLRGVSLDLSSIGTSKLPEIGQEGLMRLFSTIERSKRIRVLGKKKTFPFKLFARSSPKEAIRKTLAYLAIE